MSAGYRRCAAGLVAFIAMASGVDAPASQPQPLDGAGRGTPAFGKPKSKSSSIEEEAKRSVRVRLVCERSPAGPGTSGTLALVFEIGKDWHIYWRNAGDSGLPISVKFTAPKGVKIGEAQWPAPKRHVAPGEILDYIYEDATALFFPIEIDAGVSPPLTIRAKVDWLVCREACVPGGAEVDLALPCGPVSGPDAARLIAARSRVPRTEKEAGADVSIAWHGTALSMTAPGAGSLTFFPYESDHAEAQDMIARGAKTGDRISIGYTEQVRSADRVRGVLEIVRQGSRVFVTIDEPPPGGE